MAEGMTRIRTYSSSYRNERVFFIGKIGDNFAFALVTKKTSDNY
jgi:hypothetical protein